MDGPFYRDSLKPHVATTVGAVTLSTTNKALVPAQYLPLFPANYFNWIGKAVSARIFGQFTTGATPGNLTDVWYFGNGGDANGTLLVNGGFSGLSANVTGVSFEFDAIFRCMALGTSGGIKVTGKLLIAGMGFVMVPNTLPGTTTVDLTVANYISPQWSRSGSTAESVTFHDVLYEALN